MLVAVPGIPGERIRRSPCHQLVGFLLATRLPPDKPLTVVVIQQRARRKRRAHHSMCRSQRHRTGPARSRGAARPTFRRSSSPASRHAAGCHASTDARQATRHSRADRNSVAPHHVARPGPLPQASFRRGRCLRRAGAKSAVGLEHDQPQVSSPPQMGRPRAAGFIRPGTFVAGHLIVIPSVLPPQ